MIRIRSLGFGYHPKRPVLHDITFAVDEGEFLVLAGANGSGKSTLLSVLAGIHPPARGTISLGSQSGGASPARLRRSTGLLLQESDLQILGSTVAEDLMLGLEDSAEALDLCRETAARLGLSPWWDAPVQNLSWGQKRKLCLAATLVQKPSILLFDEPFSGLDYPSALELRRILKDNLDQGLTQIVAVHDLEPVIDMAGRLVVLSRGRVALDGPPEEILDHVKAHAIRPPSSWSMNRTLRDWE